TRQTQEMAYGIEADAPNKCSMFLVDTSRLYKLHEFVVAIDSIPAGLMENTHRAKIRVDIDQLIDSKNEPKIGGPNVPPTSNVVFRCEPTPLDQFGFVLFSRTATQGSIR